MASEGKPSVESPEYRKVEEGKGWATKTYMIVCDEGWRESIVCNGMYGWAADWLVGMLQGKPYAPEDIRRGESSWPTRVGC